MMNLSRAQARVQQLSPKLPPTCELLRIGLAQGISPDSKLVWCALVSYGNVRTGVCWPKQATLAAATGLSIRQVGAAVKALRTAGMLATSRHRLGLRYQVLRPEGQISTACRSRSAQPADLGGSDIYMEQGRENEPPPASALHRASRTPLAESAGFQPSEEPQQIAAPSVLPAPAGKREVTDSESDNGGLNVAKTLKLTPPTVTRVTNPLGTVLDLWNAHADLPKAEGTAQRGRIARALLQRYTVEQVTQAIAKFRASDWCMGRKPGSTPKTIDFILAEARMQSLLEGTYDTASPVTAKPVSKFYSRPVRKYDEL